MQQSQATNFLNAAEPICQRCGAEHFLYVIVKIINDTILTIPFNPRCTTVHELKNLIWDAVGVPAELQLLARMRHDVVQIDLWLLAPFTNRSYDPTNVMTRDERLAKCAELLETFGADITEEVALMCHQTYEMLQQIHWWQRGQLNAWESSISSSTILLEIVAVIHREIDYEYFDALDMGDTVAVWALLLRKESCETNGRSVSSKALAMYAAAKEVLEEAKTAGSSGYDSATSLTSSQKSTPLKNSAPQTRPIRTAILCLKQR